MENKKQGRKMSEPQAGEVVRLGLDPGNASIKAVLISGGQVNSFILPSVVGIGSTDGGGLDLAGLAMVRRTEQPVHIGWNGVDYLAGPGVAEYCRPIERIDFGRFVDGDELLTLVYAALANLNLAGCRLALAVGLPVEVLRSAQAAEVTAALEARLVGSHQYRIDGREVGLEIVRVRANVAQPLGAWLDWGLSNEGRWQRGSAGRTAPVLVIDQGFHTLDLFAVEEGKPSYRYTVGDNLGMARAAELIQGNVRYRFNLELSLHEADGLIRRHLRSEPATIYVHGEPQEISQVVAQALGSVAAQVVQFVTATLRRDAARFRIILTGGGAEGLYKRLQREYPQAEMAVQPVVANARGLAKLAISGFLN